MIRLDKTLARLLLVIPLFLVVTTTTLEAQTPDASLALTGAVASGSDATWAGCVLIYKGKKHECSLTGLEAPVAGTARVSAMIFNLPELGNFAGTYQPTEGSSSKGQDYLTVLNDKTKAVMMLNPFGELVELKIADEGLKVELKE